MKVGLVDVDGKGRKRCKGGAVYPNIALAKLSRWHKQHGDEVEWADAFTHYDVLYMSKVFKFTPDDTYCYQADKIIRGGTGYDIASKLPDEVDRLQPDYSIYPSVKSNTAYGFLTRGCPNKCPWCVVPRKEGSVRPYMDVDDIAIEGRKNIVLMDNNILACRDYAMEQLHKIIDRGYRIDFNQAMDARLVDDELAMLLAKVKWIDRRIRFGCDTLAQIKQCERAIALINSHGYKGDYFLYTIINSDFNEAYERIHFWWMRNRECRAKHGTPNIYPYAQPYRNPDKDEPLPQWQKDMAAWVNKREIFQRCDFAEFQPRKNFKCKNYLK